jgi:predicted nicotinamide N-methyase
MTSPRGFVLHHTRLRPVPGLESIKLHLADEVLPLWRAVQVEIEDPDAALPYWAFAWSGGLALAHYLADHPETVSGKRVLDLGSGSGLCAIAAAVAGAVTVAAVDIDRHAVAAVGLNARANKVRVEAVKRDILDDPTPDVDVILAGDCWYESGLAERVMPWLGSAWDAGVDVLLGDPRRRYLATDGLEELASYDVRTTTELEDLEHKRSWVYAFGDA